MEETQREMEVPLGKTYRLPDFKIIPYKGYFIAVAPELAKWLILENKTQRDILFCLVQGKTIQNTMDQYPDAESDIVHVLTQLEAKAIETCRVKSIFSNTRLHLHLTNLCNLRCPHCYMKSGLSYKEELSTEEIQNLCRDFHDQGGTDVSLTGGEPSSRPDFRNIVAFISQLGMKVAIYTNGCLWDENLVEFVCQYHLDGVQISLDGYDEDSNAVVRGKGSFEKSLRTIDLFARHNIPVKVAVSAPYEILKAHSDAYIDFSKRLLKQYGEDSLVFNYSYFFMPGRALDAAAIEAHKNEYYNLVSSVVNGIYGDVSEDSFINNLIDDCIFDSCGYGGLNVMPNGDFYFCDRITDVSKAGNVRNMPFPEIHRLMKIAEEAGRIGHFRPCCHCELRFICGGGCRAEYFREFTKTANIENVDFNAIAPRVCTQENKERIYDLMIQSNERFFC